MPYKDPVKAKAAQRKANFIQYYKRKAARPTGICVTCPKPVDEEGFKKCKACRLYMRERHKLDRSAPKLEGQCSAGDCKRAARPGLKMCLRCSELQAKSAKRPKCRARRKDWRDEARAEVLEAYGAKCLCCGEDNLRVLTVDHADGYKGGPRSGFALYLWLIKHVFPAGFRVLCMKCNFTLGHHGYCPHSNLKQAIKLGRPQVRAVKSITQRDERRSYTQKLKMDCLNAYGGPVCYGCDEANHECLSIDHIANDGAAHRKTDKRAKNLYILLRAQGYPPGFQVMCMNCNHLKAHVHRETLAAANKTPQRSNLNMETAANA